jgi:putative transposase
MKLMCRVLQVSRSGYYAWLKRAASKRQGEEQLLRVQVRTVFVESKGRYGSPRVHAELRQRGIQAGRHRVARLMRQEQLQARRRRRFTRTTDSRHDHPIARNLLERRFEVMAPNQAWASDITYIPTEQGWLFLAVVMDLCSRRIVGWSMSRRIDTALALAALRMALEDRRPAAGLLHHSDRGVQYAAGEYQALLAQHRVVPSMSRTGDCWDNAVVESFFSSLKTELMAKGSFKSTDEAQARLFEYLEVFYNRRRLHSTLGYRSPEVYEAQVL